MVKNAYDGDLEELYRKQRAEKGYSDSDVWNFRDWFPNIASKMLRELAENHQGFPMSLYKEYYMEHKEELSAQNYREWMLHMDENDQRKQRDKIERICDERWTAILSQMAFLLEELDEETCTWHKEHEERKEKLNEFYERFKEEFEDGERLKTVKEKKEEKEGNYYICVMPDRHPNKDFRKGYSIALKEVHVYEKKMRKYQNQCKREFMKLFEKYFWDLWD